MEWDTAVGGRCSVLHRVIFSVRCPVLQALLGAPGSRSGFSPSSPPPSSAGGKFFSVAPSPPRKDQREKISPTSQRREISELTVRMAVASVGDAPSPVSSSSLGGALRQAEGNGIPQAERADLVRMWDAWGHVVAA